MTLSKIFALGVILLAAACSGGGEPTAPIAAPHYSLPDKPGGRMCVMQCKSALEHCKQACSFQERGCANTMLSQAIKDYEAYSLQQFKERKPVELRPRDFERPEQCEAKLCREKCDLYYNGCYEKCGGKVAVAPSPCQFFCF